MIHYESMSDKRRIPHGMIGEVLEFPVHGEMAPFRQQDFANFCQQPTSLT